MSEQPNAETVAKAMKLYEYQVRYVEAQRKYDKAWAEFEKARAAADAAAEETQERRLELYRALNGEPDLPVADGVS